VTVLTGVPMLLESKVDVTVVGTPNERRVVSGKKEIKCGAPVRQSASVLHNGSNKHLPASAELVALNPGIARITAASAKTLSNTSRRSAGSAAVNEGAIWTSWDYETR
jgi:hypothetical protein